MQLADVLCYIVLTITVTASCARSEGENKEVEELQDDRRIRKREATIIMGLNGNQMDKIFHKPKVIYRRISMSRFGTLNSKYGPARPKTKSRKGARKPGKGRRTGKPKTTSPKYGPPVSKNKPYPNKKRVSKSKPKYDVPKYRPGSRAAFGHVLKTPHYYFLAPGKSSFGEPPAHVLEHQTHKQSFGEPPVDSYGAPLKPVIEKVYPTSHSFQDSTPHDDIHDNKNQEYQWNHKYVSSDSSHAFTKKEPSFSNFVTPNPKDSHIDSSDPIINEQQVQSNKFYFRKKRPVYFSESKVVNRPWKPNKQHAIDEEIIVGGQYAEPPARYVPKIRQNSLMVLKDDDEDAFPIFQSNSPYLNYKHSNMAFSPQNLNDAFSIENK